MTQRTRVLIALAVLVVAAGVVLGIDALQRKRASTGEIPAGAIPLYLDGKMLAAFTPADLEELGKASFADAEEGKTQEGWMLRDIVRLYVSDRKLKADSVVTISSSSRDKSAKVTWAEADDRANMVLLALSNRGTLKLVSLLLPGLDTRNEWVQDLDRIEVTSP